jgi:hypothetical protein
MYEGEYFDTEIPIINDLTDLDDYRADLKARQIALENHIKAEDDAKRQKRQEQLDRENNVIETPKYIPPKTDKEN